MELWGTPASMLTQGKACPFKRTFSETKEIEIKILSGIPFCFNLNIRPLCQTLSNALDISKNTALTSRLSSKD